VADWESHFLEHSGELIFDDLGRPQCGSIVNYERFFGEKGRSQFCPFMAFASPFGTPSQLEIRRWASDRTEV
jgi:hypothetical protein